VDIVCNVCAMDAIHADSCSPDGAGHRPGEITQVGEEDCTIATLRGSGVSNLPA